MNMEDYIKATERQLSRKIHRAFEKDLKMLVKSFIEVDKDQMIKLLPQDAQPGQFFFLYPRYTSPTIPNARSFQTN